MVREILIWPHAVLAQYCRPVASFDEGLRRLAKDMEDTMLKAKGAGLAASQLGVPIRLVTVLVIDGNGVRSVVPLVNPVIMERRESQLLKEGCLSLPGVVEQVRRSTWVKVAAQDVEGNRIEVEGDGLLAHSLQHELDHLDGVVFVDHLSNLKRSVARKQLTKAKARGMRYNADRPEPQDFTAGT
jgi:peptide deformylase